MINHCGKLFYYRFSELKCQDGDGIVITGSVFSLKIEFVYFQNGGKVAGDAENWIHVLFKIYVEVLVRFIY